MLGLGSGLGLGLAKGSGRGPRRRTALLVGRLEERSLLAGAPAALDQAVRGDRDQTRRLERAARAAVAVTCVDPAG